MSVVLIVVLVVSFVLLGVLHIQTAVHLRRARQHVQRLDAIATDLLATNKRLIAVIDSYERMHKVSI